MSSLARRALAGLGRFQIALAMMLFLPAGTWNWWRGWLLWGTLTVLNLAITLYFLRRDPRLIERRLHVGAAAEAEPVQKIIQGLAGLLCCLLIILPGIDSWAGWSHVDNSLSLAGEAAIVTGYGIVFLTFRANTHAAGVVQVEPGQSVISTGPYSVVRHPMYLGSAIVFLAIPVVLGSWWSLIIAGLLLATLVVRLLQEEQYLRAHLAGYDEYCRKVPQKLIPLVW